MKIKVKVTWPAKKGDKVKITATPKPQQEKRKYLASKPSKKWKA